MQFMVLICERLRVSAVCMCTYSIKLGYRGPQIKVYLQLFLYRLSWCSLNWSLAKHYIFLFCCLFTFGQWIKSNATQKRQLNVYQKTINIKQSTLFFWISKTTNNSLKFADSILNWDKKIPLIQQLLEWPRSTHFTSLCDLMQLCWQADGVITNIRLLYLAWKVVLVNTPFNVQNTKSRAHVQHNENILKKLRINYFTWSKGMEKFISTDDGADAKHVSVSTPSPALLVQLDCACLYEAYVMCLMTSAIKTHSIKACRTLKTDDGVDIKAFSNRHLYSSLRIIKILFWTISKLWEWNQEKSFNPLILQLVQSFMIELITVDKRKSDHGSRTWQSGSNRTARVGSFSPLWLHPA